MGWVDVGGWLYLLHTYVGAVIMESEEDDLVDTCNLQKAFMF